jgi:hypothetical protein
MVITVLMPVGRIVLLFSDAETPTASSQAMSVTERAGFPGGLFRVGLNLGCLAVAALPTCQRLRDGDGLRIETFR